MAIRPADFWAELEAHKLQPKPAPPVQVVPNDDSPLPYPDFSAKRLKKAGTR
jgi:hypothetical protein